VIDCRVVLGLMSQKLCLGGNVRLFSLGRFSGFLGSFLLGVWVLGCGVGCRTKTPSVPPSAVSLQEVASPKPVVRTPFVPRNLPRIDVHAHILLGSSLKAARFFEASGIAMAVNLSGASADHGFEEFVVDSEVSYGHIVPFATLDFDETSQPGYGARLAASLASARKAGARGLKISKALGLAVKGPDGKLLAVDDPGLDPVFEKAGELKMPVAIHVGDPQAFWQPPGPQNERFDELLAHPEWSFHDAWKRGDIPSWQKLFEAFLRRVARHPKTIFIGVHFGNAPEEPDLVKKALDKYTNLYIDTAARLPAIGRTDANHNAQNMRAFFLAYQDRILFGTDIAFSRQGEPVMFGSVGTDPPTEADAKQFFESTYRYFETADTDIPSPTPIQGKWHLSGVDLPLPVLEKIYFRNAEKLLGLVRPQSKLPKTQSGAAPTGDEM